LAARRVPLATAWRPARAARAAPTKATAFAVRPALTSTRFAAAFTVGLRARFARSARFFLPAAVRDLPAADLAGPAGFLATFVSAPLRAGRRFIFAISASETV
jgi:hypothetical protein